MAESAFVVQVPEAEACVGALRERFDASVKIGVPAHITVLVPFMSPERISKAVLQRVQFALNAVPAFSFGLAKVGRFPATAYLAPEPAAPFILLTESLVRSFPDYPPFGGEFQSIVPHLTVAHGSVPDAEVAAAELSAALQTHGPISSTCTSVALLENSSGLWREMHVFALPRTLPRALPRAHGNGQPFLQADWLAASRSSQTSGSTMTAMQIDIDDPARADVYALLEEHLRNMHELSPPESVHALDVSGLKSPDITFWSARAGGVLLGCGALKQLGPGHGEIKSMRTPASLRRRGAGRAVLNHILAEARRRGYTRLSLETGPAHTFLAAHQLYQSVGFRHCGPFGDYKLDPHSVFMTLAL